MDLDSKTETVSDMDTLNRNSPINKIHEAGYVAIINGDTMQIIDKCKPDEVAFNLIHYQKLFDDVGQDADGDIICFDND